MKLQSTENGVSLHMIRDRLWQEITTIQLLGQKYSDHVLYLESVCRDIGDILELNNIEK